MNAIRSRILPRWPGQQGLTITVAATYECTKCGRRESSPWLETVLQCRKCFSEILNISIQKREQ